MAAAADILKEGFLVKKVRPRVGLRSFNGGTGTLKVHW